MLLLIDNYDSFTWNLAHDLGRTGASVHVHRNDRITISEIHTLAPTHDQQAMGVYGNLL